MSFYIYAWIATVSFGISVFLVKLTSKYSISNPWLFNFLLNLFVAILFVPLAFYNTITFPTDWGNIVGASLFNALFAFLFFLIIYKLDVSVASPLYNFRAVFAIILGALLLNQNLHSQQFLFFAVIFIAGIFATYTEKFSLKSFFNKAVGMTILAMFCLALSNVFIGKVIQTNSVWTTTFWINWVTLIFLLPTVSKFYKDLPKVTVNQMVIITIVSAFSLIGTIAANIAYGVNVGITSIILALPISMLLAFFFALFMPKLLEKHTLRVYVIRFTAVAIMIYSAL